MKKPVSPAEWDAATPRQRRAGLIPATRPTQESYEAEMAIYEAKMARNAELEVLMAGLEKIGGREWIGGNQFRFYFGSSYFDMNKECFIENEGGMTTAEFNTARAVSGF